MGAKIPGFGYIVRRKCPVSSSSYELHKKLQNLYASVQTTSCALNRKIKTTAFLSTYPVG